MLTTAQLHRTPRENQQLVLECRHDDCHSKIALRDRFAICVTQHLYLATKSLLRDKESRLTCSFQPPYLNGITDIGKEAKKEL